MDRAFLDTEIDELLIILSSKGKMTLAEAGKIIGVDEKTMHVWVDSLVEEKIIILDYDFLTPVIMLTPQKKKEIEENKKVSELRKREDIAKKIGMKGLFFQKARTRKIPERRIPIIWRKYIEINEASIKKEFMDKANKKMIEGNLERLWDLFLKQFKDCRTTYKLNSIE